jgi:hypothetical protein
MHAPRHERQHRRGRALGIVGFFGCGGGGVIVGGNGSGNGDMGTGGTGPDASKSIDGPSSTPRRRALWSTYDRNKLNLAGLVPGE